MLGVAGRWRVSVASTSHAHASTAEPYPLADMLPEQLTMGWDEPDETAQLGKISLRKQIDKIENFPMNPHSTLTPFRNTLFKTLVDSTRSPNASLVACLSRRIHR